MKTNLFDFRFISKRSLKADFSCTAFCFWYNVVWFSVFLKWLRKGTKIVQDLKNCGFIRNFLFISSWLPLNLTTGVRFFLQGCQFSCEKDDMSNVTVCVRFRPLNSREKRDHGDNICIQGLDAESFVFKVFPVSFVVYLGSCLLKTPFVTTALVSGRMRRMETSCFPLIACSIRILRKRICLTIWQCL